MLNKTKNTKSHRNGLNEEENFTKTLALRYDLIIRGHTHKEQGQPMWIR